MDALHTTLHRTAFRAPLLRTIIPTTSLALALNILTFIAVLLIVAFQTNTPYPSAESYLASDAYKILSISAALTSPTCVLFSFFLPYLHAREANRASGIPWALSFSDYFDAPRPGLEGWWWRQAALSACAVLAGWVGRATGIPLFRRTPWPHWSDLLKSKPQGFGDAAFELLSLCLTQALRTSIALLPVMAVNAVPRSAFATARLHHVYTKIPSPIPITPYVTDLLGLTFFTTGLLLSLSARALSRSENFDYSRLQTVTQGDDDGALDDGLGSPTAGLNFKELASTALAFIWEHPDIAGELLMWTGIAVVAAGLLVRRPALTGLGLSLGGRTFEFDFLDQGLGGQLLVIGLCVGSLAYVGLESVRRSEER